MTSAVFGNALGFILLRLSLALIPLWLVVGFAMMDESPVVHESVGFLIAAVLGLAAAWASLMLSVRFRPFVVTPLPMMLAFFSLHFGLGPWVHFTEEGGLPNYANGLLVDQSGFFRVQILNLAGFTFLLMGIWLSKALMAAIVRSHSDGTVWQPVMNSRLALHQSILQGAFSDAVLRKGWYFFAGIALLLWIADRVLSLNLLGLLPGFLNSFERFGWVAALLGGLLVGRDKGRVYILLPVGLGMVEGALRLRKSMMLFPILLAVVGLYVSGRSSRVLLVGALIAVVLYAAVQPIIEAGRANVWSFRSMSGVQFYELLLHGDLTIGKAENLGDAGWNRLNYTPVQLALMDAYDAGRAGNTISKSHWMFIPRFIAGETKPILDFGVQVTLELFKHDKSSTGPTIFGEAYWNGGWLLVAFISIVAGGIFYAMTYASLWLLMQARVLAWPIILLGVMAGQMVSNFFSSGLVGTAVVFFALTGLFRLYYRPRVL